MNYETASDLEINEAVADKLNMWVQTEFGGMIGLTESFRKEYPSTIWARPKDDSDCWEQYNYCLSPSDAWAIIDLIWGSLNVVIEVEYETVWVLAMIKYDCSNLRAAMIVYLMMNEV